MLLAFARCAALTRPAPLRSSVPSRAASSRRPYLRRDSAMRRAEREFEGAAETESARSRPSSARPASQSRRFDERERGASRAGGRPSRFDEGGDDDGAADFRAARSFPSAQRRGVHAADGGRVSFARRQPPQRTSPHRNTFADANEEAFDSDEFPLSPRPQPQRQQAQHAPQQQQQQQQKRKPQRSQQRQQQQQQQRGGEPGKQQRNQQAGQRQGAPDSSTTIGLRMGIASHGHDMKHVLDINFATETRTKISLCRCWRSSVFPLCDGTHNKLRSAGEQVGPIIITLTRPTGDAQQRADGAATVTATTPVVGDPAADQPPIVTEQVLVPKAEPAPKQKSKTELLLGDLPPIDDAAIAEANDTLASVFSVTETAAPTSPRARKRHASDAEIEG